LHPYEELFAFYVQHSLQNACTNIHCITTRIIALLHSLRYYYVQAVCGW